MVVSCLTLFLRISSVYIGCYCYQQKWFIVGQSDEAEVASRDTEPHMVSNDVPSQPRNPSNQFFASNMLMQVRC